MTQQGFTFRYNFDELLAATWLSVRRKWIWKGALRYIGAMTAVMTAILEATASEHDLPGFIANIVTGVFVGSAALTVKVLYWLWCVPRSARKSYAQLSLDGGSVEYTFDNQNLEIADSTTTLKLPWDRWVKWTQNEDILLLYRTDAQAHYVPKKQVQSEWVEAIKAHLDGAGVKRF